MLYTFVRPIIGVSFCLTLHINLSCAEAQVECKRAADHRSEALIQREAQGLERVAAQLPQHWSHDKTVIKGEAGADHNWKSNICPCLDGKQGLLISPDGTRIIRCLKNDQGYVAIVFDVQTGALVQRFPHVDAALQTVVWSPHGRFVVDYDHGSKNIRVWDLQRGTVAPLVVQNNIVGVSWDPQGRYITVMGQQHAIEIVDATTQRSLYQGFALSEVEAHMRALWNRAGTYVGIITNAQGEDIGGVVNIYAVDNGTLRRVAVCNQEVERFAWLNDTTLVFIDKQGLYSLQVDVQDSDPKGIAGLGKQEERVIYELLCSKPEASIVVISYRDIPKKTDSILVLDLAKVPQPLVWRSERHGTEELHGNNSLFLVAQDTHLLMKRNGTVTLYTMAIGNKPSDANRIVTIKPFTEYSASSENFSLSVSPSGDQFACRHKSGKIKLYDAWRGTLLCEVPAKHNQWVGWSADGKLMAQQLDDVSIYAPSGRALHAPRVIRTSPVVRAAVPDAIAPAGAPAPAAPSRLQAFWTFLRKPSVFGPLLFAAVIMCGGTSYYRWWKKHRLPLH